MRPNEKPTEDYFVISPDPRLIRYIERARNIGKSDTLISQELQNAGWPQEYIKQALL